MKKILILLFVLVTSNLFSQSILFEILKSYRQKTFSCGDSIYVYHQTTDSVAPVNKVVWYKTDTSSSSGSLKCFTLKNLGATTQASSATDNTESSAGWYWQFNRKQGYRYTSSRTPNTTWITSINENSNWILTEDPCRLELGSDWRIWTSTELSSIDSYYSWANYNNTYSSFLKIHAAGYLGNSDGIVSERGMVGAYMTSTQYSNTEMNYIYITNSFSFVSNGQKTRAGTVRCIRD